MKSSPNWSSIPTILPPSGNWPCKLPGKLIESFMPSKGILAMTDPTTSQITTVPAERPQAARTILMTGTAVVIPVRKTGRAGRYRSVCQQNSNKLRPRTSQNNERHVTTEESADAYLGGANAGDG